MANATCKSDYINFLPRPEKRSMKHILTAQYGFSHWITG